MGRFGGLFKKSDKSKGDENPYAQQPAAQSAPPQQYGQYNQNQYNDNRYATQSSQGAPSGLPSGPRPGGLPSRAGPGPSRTGTSESNKTSGPPPPYSDHPANGPPRPSYNGISGPGRSPAPLTGNGFPKEKFGAQDGFGRNRFEPAAPSPYDRSPAPGSQRSGGYGGLDSDNGGLFDNYKPPRQQFADPSPAQAGPSYGAPEQYGDSQQMTEEEEVQEKKAQIVGITRDTRDVAFRVRENANLFLQGTLAAAEQTFEQGRVMSEAEKKTMSAGVEINKGKVNLTNLDNAQSMWNFAGNSKTAIQAREERKMMYHRDNEAELSAIEREEMQTEQRKAALGARLEAQQQNRARGLLGGNKANNSAFEFEDEDGEQRELNNDIDEAQDAALFALRQAKFVLKAQHEEVERQNKQMDRMTERIERSKDDLWQNHVHLETKYLK